MNQEHTFIDGLKLQAKILHKSIQLCGKHPSFNILQTPSPTPTLQQCQDMFSEAYNFKTLKGAMVNASTESELHSNILRKLVYEANYKNISLSELEFDEVLSHLKFGDDEWKYENLDSIFDVYEVAINLPYFDLWYSPKKWHESNYAFERSKTLNQYNREVLLPIEASHYIQSMLINLFIDGFYKTNESILDSGYVRYEIPFGILLNTKKIELDNPQEVRENLIKIAKLFSQNNDLTLISENINLSNLSDSYFTVDFTVEFSRTVKRCIDVDRIIDKRVGQLHDYLKNQRQEIIYFKSVNSLSGHNHSKFYSFLYFFNLTLGLANGENCDSPFMLYDFRNHNYQNIIDNLLDDELCEDRFNIYREFLPRFDKLNNLVIQLKSVLPDFKSSELKQISRSFEATQSFNLKLKALQKIYQDEVGSITNDLQSCLKSLQKRA